MHCYFSVYSGMCFIPCYPRFTTRNDYKVSLSLPQHETVKTEALHWSQRSELVCRTQEVIWFIRNVKNALTAQRGPFQWVQFSQQHHTYTDQSLEEQKCKLWTLRICCHFPVSASTAHPCGFTSMHRHMQVPHKHWAGVLFFCSPVANNTSCLNTSLNDWFSYVSNRCRDVIKYWIHDKIQKLKSKIKSSFYFLRSCEISLHIGVNLSGSSRTKLCPVICPTVTSCFTMKFSFLVIYCAKLQESCTGP